MRKIANTTELTSELRQILAYAQSVRPSRQRLARQLRNLSLRVAMEHDSPEALAKYLKEHPDADKAKHTVKKPMTYSEAKGKEDEAERAEAKAHDKRQLALREHGKATQKHQESYEAHHKDKSNKENERKHKENERSLEHSKKWLAEAEKAHGEAAENLSKATKERSETWRRENPDA